MTELLFLLVYAIVLKHHDIDQMIIIWLSIFSVIFVFTLAFIVRIKQKKNVFHAENLNSVKAGVGGNRGIGNMRKTTRQILFFTFHK